MAAKEKNNLVPKLRFKGFEGSWKTSTLGAEANVNPKTRQLPASFIYIDLESVTKGVLIKEDSIKIEDAPSRAQRVLDKGDILYQTVRPYQKNNYFFNKEGNYVASTGYAQIKSKGDNRFLFQYLHTDKFVDIVNLRSTGTSYPAISPSELVKIPITIPSLPEQEKIAAFLGAVDEKIQQLTRKKQFLEQYKKGIMQQLFSGKLRFKDDTSTSLSAGNGKAYPKWEEKKLGEYLVYKSERNKDKKVELVLSVSNKKGFITQDEQFDGYEVASKDISNYKIVHRNEIAYNPSRINVGSIARLNTFEAGIVSPMYIVFALKDTLEPNYFENLYNTYRFKYLVKIGCSGSVRDTLNYEVLADFEFSFPSYPEQKKIADFLSAIDAKINKVGEALEATNQFKKGLLQQMFV
jgi:type I restriction enzyme S subunit